jgi:hypothetical protein
MTAPNPKAEVRTITLNLRTSPTVKAMLVALAAADQRSLAQTVELLIEREHASVITRARAQRSGEPISIRPARPYFPDHIVKSASGRSRPEHKRGSRV